MKNIFYESNILYIYSFSTSILISASLNKTQIQCLNLQEIYLMVSYIPKHVI
jgi:hypothetical protein